MAQAVRIAIVGSGPAGLSAAAHCAKLGLEHLLLESAPAPANTIQRYQRGKFVMAEPSVLPLRADLPFAAGTREQILDAWQRAIAELGVRLRPSAEVVGIEGEKGAFRLTLRDGECIAAEHVVLAIGLQGNLRRLQIPGGDAPIVQYQLDDPDEYEDEHIVVVGAGDAAIENALALAGRNQVTLLNRRDAFDRAKDGNRDAVLAAVEAGTVRCVYKATPERIERDGQTWRMIVSCDDGEIALPADRIIARLGAVPPRGFVESCGVRFPSDDPAAVPEVSETYESNVPGLHIVGALAGYPLIKQAMNQGWEVVEYIEGRRPDPADTPLLAARFEPVPGWDRVADALAEIRERVPLLTPLTPLQLREFLLEGTVHRMPAGQIVFRRNDYTDTFFVIVRGEVEAEVEPGRWVPIETGRFFGEMGLISGRRRSATVRTRSDCVLIEAPARAVRRLMYSVEAVRAIIDQTFVARAIRMQLAPDASDDELAPLVQAAELRHFRRGETLFREGEPGDCLYLIRSGSVTVSRRIGEREVVLAYVPAGQYVGEMALLSDQVRNATVTAAVAVEAIAVPAAPFRRLLQANTAVRERIEAVYKARIAGSAVASAGTASSVLGFLMQQGVGEATDLLVIDETLCVGCDQCERACAATHGEVSRLDREAGASFAGLHLPTSCRHCEHPHCMKDCPPDAIRRSASGEVYITDACIGCGNCERDCPYGVIRMGASKRAGSLLGWLLLGLGPEPGRAETAGSGAKDQIKTAAKCDMCRDLPGGPACVRACPTGAAQRVSPAQLIAALEDD